MKAYKRTQNTGKGRFGGHPIQLTVAMIVKNEEETLDKCLSSLQPLLEAVPSELIITDTGSTDNTVEIAKKYTDKILHFEWCGDFSAARDTGINAARGQWFMSIDGDEWFENTDGIISFFNSGECDKYNCASYIQRNYIDAGGKDYEDFRALRIFRFYKGMKYKSKIHETIDWEPPVKFIDDYVHHYGYAYATEEERMAKHSRNMGLLKSQLEDDPYDLRIYERTAAECLVVKDFQAAIKYCEKGLEIEAQEGRHIVNFRAALSQDLLKAHAGLNDSKGVLSTCETYIAATPEENIIHLDFYRYGQIAAMRLLQYEKSIEFGKKFLKLYDRYIKNELDRSILLQATPVYDKKEERVKSRILIISACLKCGRENDAAEYIRSLDLSQPGSTKGNTINYCVTAAVKTGKWDIVSDFYRKVLNTCDAEKKHDFIFYSNDFIHTNSEDRGKLIAAIAGMEENDDFVYLNRLRMAADENNLPLKQKLLEWFLQNKKEWDDSFSDVLYFAMQSKINIMPYIMKIDTDDLKYFAADMETCHEDFNRVVEEYFESYSFENIKGLYFEVSLKEKVLLNENGLEDGEYIDLFKGYASELARYVRMVYRREMFLPSNISSLPRVCRFGYYMGEAFGNEKRIDNAGYIRNLRFALDAYPVMKKPIGFLLDGAKKYLHENNEKAAEFAVLAKKVKMQIEGLIQTGNLKEAGSITAQLVKLMPDDEDVMRYCKITGIKPSMAELATNIPQ